MPSLKQYSHTLSLASAIVLGCLAGHLFPGIGELSFDLLDYTVLLLVALLISEVPISRLKFAAQDRTTLIALWIVNFLLIPPLGYGLAAVFLRGHELAMIGLVIYLMSPCTDWFLGFVRLSKGNTALGTVFIPISMATQLAAYPVYIRLFTPESVTSQIGEMGNTIFGWFLIPLFVAIILRGVIHYLPYKAAEISRQSISIGSTVVITVLVFQIFAINVGTIIDQIEILPRMLAAILMFFIITWFLVEGFSRRLKLDYENQALLGVSCAARNAPLMLAITTMAIPDQPVVYAAIVVGMVLEFPHLTALAALLLRQRGRAESVSSPVYKRRVST